VWLQIVHLLLANIAWLLLVLSLAEAPRNGRAPAGTTDEARPMQAQPV
jgi:hypothetical protein